MKIDIIGQSVFGAEVYKVLKTNGHETVGVFTVPDDKNGRENPLATEANKDGVTTFKLQRWRQKGQILPEVLEKYKSVSADLNVLPFCIQFIPMEVITHPKHQSIIYHLYLLPRHRGSFAINLSLIAGDTRADSPSYGPMTVSIQDQFCCKKNVR